MSRATFLSWQVGGHAVAATLGRAVLRCGMGLGSPHHLAASLPVDSLRRHILDLSRRGLLRGATGLAALGALQAVAPRPLAQPRNDLSPFALGVASGDPWPGGMVIWTRLAPEPMQPEGGMPPAPVEVAWEVAEDEGFRRIAARGRALAMPERAHAVHVELSGLPPGRSWHYRFHAAGATSPIGRTRTAPAPGATPARLRLAQAGCQHYEHGFFTAWRHIAEEPDLDLVFHYGDYIYEFTLREQRRATIPAVREHADGEAVTLDQYRRRYAQYRLDPDLQAAHAAHPFAVSFDDHEVENNWAGPVSWRPQNTTPELFALRRAAAFQAWYEHMPVRAAALPRGPDITAWRSLRFGRLASLHLLDTRSFRDDQPCADRFGPPCAEVARPDAQMLGPVQEAWLGEALAQGEGWQVHRRCR